LRLLQSTFAFAAVLAAAQLSACGPHAHIPPRGVTPVPGVAQQGDSIYTLAHRLAPVLYLQRDEWFPLSRVVAVVNPTRPIIAYHLLWRDDVHGAWIPFTVPTDEEVVWVGYDPVTAAATDLWTYWHGRILHTDWHAKGPPAFDVQWGKHGSLPHGTALGDLPKTRSMNLFYAFTILGAPDIWLGNASRKGPWCFCHSYRRYREFDRPLDVAQQLDAVVRTDNAREALKAVFGKKFSDKIEWPPIERHPMPARAVSGSGTASHS
jgi:hypothetical protein